MFCSVGFFARKKERRIATKLLFCCLRLKRRKKSRNKTEIDESVKKKRKTNYRRKI